jgi:hypothetical protein
MEKSIAYLKSFNINSNFNFENIVNKLLLILSSPPHRLTFKSMNLAEKQSCVSINMDQVMNEIPIVIERLEELSKNMDDKFGWKEFKFCFKFATSHIVSE